MGRPPRLPMRSVPSAARRSIPTISRDISRRFRSGIGKPDKGAGFQQDVRRLGPIRAQSARRIFSRESAAEKVSLTFEPEKASASLFSPGYCIRRSAIFSYDPTTALEIGLERPIGGYPSFH